METIPLNERTVALRFLPSSTYFSPSVLVKIPEPTLPFPDEPSDGDFDFSAAFFVVFFGLALAGAFCCRCNVNPECTNCELEVNITSVVLAFFRGRSDESLSLLSCSAAELAESASSSCLVRLAMVVVVDRQVLSSADASRQVASQCAQGRLETS